MANRNVELFANGMEIARRAADKVVRIASEAAAAQGVFTIALSGGSTPKVLYALLAENPALRNSLPWDKMQVFFGDERHVGPGHRQRGRAGRLSDRRARRDQRPRPHHQGQRPEFGAYGDAAQHAALEGEGDC